MIQQLKCADLREALNTKWPLKHKSRLARGADDLVFSWVLWRLSRDGGRSDQFLTVMQEISERFRVRHTASA
jgi:hypothetical protein